MSMDYMYIGSTPVEEDCAQTGGKYDWAKLQRIECNAYIKALRIKYGEEPEGAVLRIKTENHDFGSYREVVCMFDPDKQEAVEYACKVENGLATWAEVGMHAPVLYLPHGEPTITPEDQLMMADTLKRIYGDNPPDYSEKGNDGTQA